MRLTDIPLDWALPSLVGLGGIAVAAALYRGRRRAAEDSEAVDGPEPGAQRRRRKEAVYGSASYLLLFCCAAVAAALSFHGLVGFGRQNLGLSDGWEYLVPFGLDGAAMFCSVLAVREASHGDAALGSRLLVWLFAGAAAWFNWVHAPRGIGHAGAPHFFAGMSLSAAVLFDRALKQTRRAALREQGLVPRPLPQIRMVRWLRAPRETYAAWSLMLLEGVNSLDEAVDEVREDRRRREADRLRRRDQSRLDRARIRAYNRQHRLWTRGRESRPAEVTGVTAAAAVGSSEPAISEPPPLTTRSRPALRAAPPLEKAVEAAEPVPCEEPTPARSSPSGEHGDEPAGDLGTAGTAGPAESGHPVPAPSRTMDVATEDNTLTAPRLASLEEKLAEIERQFG